MVKKSIFFLFKKVDYFMHGLSYIKQFLGMLKKEVEYIVLLYSPTAVKTLIPSPAKSFFYFYVSFS